MVLKDKNGNPLGAAVAVDPAKGCLEVFAVDDSGIPLSCLWVLTNRGGQLTVGKGSTATTISANGSSYFGALEGTPSQPPYLPVITVGPSASTAYFAPPQEFFTKTIDAVLTAVPVNGSANRSLYISVQKTLPAF